MLRLGCSLPRYPSHCNMPQRCLGWPITILVRMVYGQILLGMNTLTTPLKNEEVLKHCVHGQPTLPWLLMEHTNLGIAVACTIRRPSRIEGTS